MYQTEKPITKGYTSTQRSLDPNTVENQHLNKDTSEEFLNLLREVKIRFDTNPRLYQKEDYKKLLELLQLSNGGSSAGVSELQELVDALSERVAQLESKLDQQVSDIETLQDQVSDINTGEILK